MKLISYLLAYVESLLGCRIYPLELVRRATLRGPMMTDITSSPNQWAGRTTISSGSATSTVSTFSVGSDSILNLAIQAALPAAYTTRGLISIAAGAATGTASTTAVYSGQAVLLSYLNATNAASGQANDFRVNSIVDGVSFAAVTGNGANVTSGPAVVSWQIPEAVPQGIKVNSISSGNYFTLGWADGRARPVDTTVMWEVRRPS